MQTKDQEFASVFFWKDQVSISGTNTSTVSQGDWVKEETKHLLSGGELYEDSV